MSFAQEPMASASTKATAKAIAHNGVLTKTKPAVAYPKKLLNSSLSGIDLRFIAGRVTYLKRIKLIS
jgi:hypothetical protein